MMPLARFMHYRSVAHLVNLKYKNHIKIFHLRQISDKNVPKCSDDLSFNSRVILDLKLQTSEPPENFRTVSHTSTDLALKGYYIHIKIILDFDQKILEFKTRKFQDHDFLGRIRIR